MAKAASQFAASFDRLDALLNHRASRALVREFFSTEGPFEGDLLHTLGNNPRDEIVIDDLFSITMLDVRVWPRGARRLLNEGQHRTDVSKLLSKIPNREDIWDGSCDFSKNGEASRLYHLLQSNPGDGIGPVTAGKLLARKRPRLVPIVDSVVSNIVEAPTGCYWQMFREYLASARRRKKVEALRPPKLNALVPTLRLVDVMVWMHGSQGKPARDIRAGLGL